MQPSVLFVYGSLRRNASHHWLLTADCRYLGQARFRGCLYQVADYPGLVRSAHPEHWVLGELYALVNPEAALARLDVYEGCSAACTQPHEFVREPCPVQLSDGTQQIAWVYLYQLPTNDLQVIHSGDFLAVKPE